MSVLAVTGATGNVGGRVARLLAAGGVPQRLVVRDAGRAPSLPGATVVTSTYGDGYDATIVNGRVFMRGGEPTGELAGTVLRSGPADG